MHTHSSICIIRNPLSLAVVVYDQTRDDEEGEEQEQEKEEGDDDDYDEDRSDPRQISNIRNFTCISQKIL